MADLIYDIDVKYNIVGASGVAGHFNQIGSAAKSAQNSIIGFGNSLRSVLIGGGIAGALVAAKKYFIDFNSEMEQVQIGMATAIGAIYATPFKNAMLLGKDVREELAKFSRNAPGGMQDYFKGFEILSTGLRNASISLHDMVKDTEVLTAASMVRGLGGNVLLQQLNRSFLSEKGVRSTTSELIKFLSMGGVSLEQYKKFDLATRIEAAVKIAKSGAFRDALLEQGKSFEALWDSASNSMQFALGHAGEGLFHVVKDALKEFNTWFDTNQVKIYDWAEKFGHALVSGFKFMIDHREAIMMIAGAFALAPIVGAAGTIGSGIVAAGGIAAFATGVGEAALALAALTAAVYGLNKAFGGGSKDITWRDKAMASIFGPTDNMIFQEKLGHRYDFNEDRLRLAGSGVLRGGAGLISSEQHDLIAEILKMQGYTSTGAGLGKFEEEKFRKNEALIGQNEETIGKWTIVANRFIALLNLLGITDQVFGKGADPGKSKPIINQNITNYNTFQVASNDPDRFAVQFIEAISKQSSRSLRGRRY